MNIHKVLNCGVNDYFLVGMECVDRFFFILKAFLFFYCLLILKVIVIYALTFPFLYFVLNSFLILIKIF